ncbi:MAG: HEAT repeat domain-containing protein [Planctomycetes bacterium]|nr:HEAT repeat domain-containing protein [Planctomycetota bacterium]
MATHHRDPVSTHPRRGSTAAALLAIVIALAAAGVAIYVLVMNAERDEPKPPVVTIAAKPAGKADESAERARAIDETRARLLDLEERLRRKEQAGEVREEDVRRIAGEVLAAQKEQAGAALTAEEVRRIVAEELAKRAAADKPGKDEAAAGGAAGAEAALDEKWAKFKVMGLKAFESQEFKEWVEALKASGTSYADRFGEALAHGKTNSEKFVAAATMEALKDPKAVPYLDNALQNESDNLLRRMVSHALAFIDTPDAIPALERGVADDEPGVAVNSAFGLAKLGNQTGVDHLLRVGGEKENPMRLAAIQSMMLVKNDQFRPFLWKLLDAEKSAKDPTARILGIHALANNATADDLDRLKGLIEDPAEQPNIKEEARKVYNKVAGEKVYPED